MKICVPIVESTDELILKEARNLKDTNVDLIELRVDFYEDIENIDKVKALLKKIKVEVKELPLLFTFRTISEGGNRKISIDYYDYLNSEIAKSKLVNFIDIELNMFCNDLIDDIKQSGVDIIISSHDFNKTPSKDIIINKLKKMQELGGDICKIAVMANSPRDVITLLDATEEMNRLYAKVPIITISMGELGKISRISGDLFGSYMTFASNNKSSAPGQIKLNELQTILEIRGH
jgi:3-dehydroquinate dehydratase-1